MRNTHDTFAHPLPVNHTPTHASTSLTPPTYTSISSLLMPSQCVLLSPTATSTPDDSEMEDAPTLEISSNDNQNEEWKVAVVTQMREAVDWLVAQYRVYTTGGGNPITDLDYNKVDTARKTWRRSLVQLYGEGAISQLFVSRTTADNNFHYRLFSDPGPDDYSPHLHNSDEDDQPNAVHTTLTLTSPSPPLPASWQLPPLPPPYDDDIDNNHPHDHQQQPPVSPQPPPPQTAHQQQQPTPTHPTAATSMTRPPPGPATRAGLAQLAAFAASIASTSANYSQEPPTASPRPPQLDPSASAAAAGDPTPTPAPTPAFATFYDPTQTPPPPMLRDDHVAPPPPPPPPFS